MSATAQDTTSTREATLTEGKRVNERAIELFGQGRYAESLPLAQRALEISEKTQGPQHPNTRTGLSNLGRVYLAMGRYEQALPLLQRALAIAEKNQGPNHPEIGLSLANLGGLYQDIGRFEQALPLYERALMISERTKGPDHPETGIDRSNLATLYSAMGRYESALPMPQRALAIVERAAGPGHPSTGVMLHNLASLYTDINRDEQALALYQRALSIRETTQGPEHPDTGATLSAIGMLYLRMGRTEQALTLLQRALTISEKAEGPEHPNTSRRLSNLAHVYWAMGRGENEKALPLSERTLAISEKAVGTEHPLTGVRLHDLGGLYYAMGRYEDALRLMKRALPIALRGDLPQSAWRVQNSLRMALTISDPLAAIYWGKQSVNTIQSMRAGLYALDRETQQSFLRDKRDVYTDLTDLLIAQGRIIEAQRVMALLKEEEFFEFIRRDAEADPRQSQLPMTGAEAAAAERMEVVRSRLGALFIEHQGLQDLQRRGGLTDAERQRLAAIAPEIAAARTAFDGFLASLSQQLTAQGGERSALVGRIESHQNLLENLGAAGKGVAAVQYVASGEQLSIIVSSTAGQQAVQIKLKESDLNRRVAAFRSVVQDPRLDPWPLGRELARQLLDPIAQTLQQQGIHTLLLMLDGTLRYVPFAALVAEDGRYLVQHYQLAVYTEVAATSLVAQPRRSWKVAAMGVTRAFPKQNFSALPAVLRELQAIVRPEVLSGTTHLDEDFTLTQFKASLDQPVLHIASHFRFLPGSDESFLLLGDGSGLTLRQLRTELPRLTGVDLLTLSACETAVGGGIKADGREVEGLGVLAQKRGARAVMASLWPVGDASTGELMVQFYQQRQVKNLNKAQALRQAQLSMLNGQVADPDGAPEQRGTSRTGGAGTQQVYTPDPQRPYAHPFFWAPFILMGNWL